MNAKSGKLYAGLAPEGHEVLRHFLWPGGGEPHQIQVQLQVRHKGIAVHFVELLKHRMPVIGQHQADVAAVPESAFNCSAISITWAVCRAS